MDNNTLLKSALLLAAGFAVSAASAIESQIRAIGFESPAYTNDTAISLYEAYGWTAGATDSSKIRSYSVALSNDNSQYLELNTSGSLVSNALANASDINSAIANSGVAYFDYEVKFVPAYTACSSIVGNDDTKVAFYALASAVDTNLVVVTKDGAGVISHETTSVRIDCTQSVAVHVEITTTNSATAYSVKVGDAVATSLKAVDASGSVPGRWFRTINAPDKSTIAHCKFSGTGNLDNFTYGTRTSGSPSSSYPVYIDTASAAMKKAYDDWASANKVADGAGFEDQYLMNVGSDVNVNYGIKITSITVGAETVTVVVEENLDALDSLSGINGQVVIKGAETLAGPWSQIGEAVEISSEGKAVFSGDVGSAKFIKAYVVNPYAHE